MKAIHGVIIGDKFIDSKDRKTKNISTVVDILEKKSLKTGEVVGYECIAEKQFCGQTLRFETPFCSVLIRKVEPVIEVEKISVLTGHLTAGNKKAIKAIFKTGARSGKVGRTEYYLKEGKNVWTVNVGSRERHCIGAELKYISHPATFTI